MSDREDDVKSGVSRREFLKISGIAAASVPLIAGPTVLTVAGEEVEIHGPGKSAIKLNVNGKNCSAELEPRVTLLDALREDFEITGPKRVCDRGACGACTVLMENAPVYACSVLAIEAQGKRIVTVEGLMQGEQLHPVQAAFVENDAQQCGFCTPGFVVATKAFLDKHPNPTPEQVHRGLGGNFCRCGTYDGIRKVVSQLAKT
ncbi:MAG TPA: (2Fe-2S)-binding protein [Terriglobales bacterium]|jgi:xanthine dehydrogenase YagT iron-sulfur-binding subunit|nr:(2Fe-2S)-binding protein [Terriglobales bacterium]